MANQIAHEGIRKILNLLEDEEVNQLAITSTQHRLKPELIKNKQDAVETIIRYSPDYSIILNRKSVKRDILFQYLHENSLVVTPPITKLTLIQRILEFWTTSSKENEICSRNAEDSNDNDNTVSVTEDVNLMATKFTEWFYAMMNEDDALGEEHFWSDCSLKLNLMSQSNNIENSVENNRAEVVKMLRNIKLQHHLFFNPNLTKDGVYGKMNAHGLVMIFVCGTLHTSDICVGVFEQIFALARDPFCENNWKIKHSKLNLQSKDAVATVPTLCESGLSNELLVSLTDT